MASSALRADPRWSQAIVDGRACWAAGYGDRGRRCDVQVRTAPLDKTKWRASCGD